PVLSEYRELGEELVTLARRQEEVRRWPEIRYTELTLAGYRQEQARAATAQAERNRIDADRMREAKRASLGRTIRWTVIWFGLALVLLGFAVSAFAGTEPHIQTTVIVLDLSSSS